MEKNFKISPLTSIEVGGFVKIYDEFKDRNELENLLKILKKEKIKIFFLGDGTNVIFPDESLEIAVLKNKIKGIKITQKGIEVYSGTSLNQLVEFAVENGFEGFEELSGIPGTVGGAIFGNAGAFGKEIKDLIEELYFVDFDGKVYNKNKEKLNFSYRWSEFKKNYSFVLKVVFKIKKGDKSRIKNKREEVLNLRRKKLPPPPPEVKSSGSFFKNILLPDGKKVSVAKLIDSLGFKGFRIGDAMVSEKHANFLINAGNAKCIDFVKLSGIIKEKVKNIYGFELEEEVIFVKNFVKNMKIFHKTE